MMYIISNKHFVTSDAKVRKSDFEKYLPSKISVSFFYIISCIIIISSHPLKCIKTIRTLRLQHYENKHEEEERKRKMEIHAENAITLESEGEKSYERRVMSSGFIHRMIYRTRLEKVREKFFFGIPSWFQSSFSPFRCFNSFSSSFKVGILNWRRRKFFSLSISHRISFSPFSSCSLCYTK